MDQVEALIRVVVSISLEVFVPPLRPCDNAHFFCLEREKKREKKSQRYEKNHSAFWQDWHSASLVGKFSTKTEREREREREKGLADFQSFIRCVYFCFCSQTTNFLHCFRFVDAGVIVFIFSLSLMFICFGRRLEQFWWWTWAFGSLIYSQLFFGFFFVSLA